MNAERFVRFAQASRTILGAALLCVFLASAGLPSQPQLLRIELYPQKFELRAGERIRYTAIGVTDAGRRVFLEKLCEFTFATGDQDLLRLESRSGLFQAVSPGPAAVIVRTADGTLGSFPIAISDQAFILIEAQPSQAVPAIRTGTLLSVVHANRDGFDHTGVAKPGIDAAISRAKASGWTVLYVVDPDYPNWNTDDRRPTHAVASSTGAHQLSIDAERIVFVGGNFYWCLAADVHSTLEALLAQSPRRTFELLLPQEAIYDGRKGHPYPEPMIQLATLLEQYPDRETRYEEAIVPFLKRALGEEPVHDDPRGHEPPKPAASRALSDCQILVNFPPGPAIVYREGRSDRQVTFTFIQNIDDLPDRPD